LLNRREVAEILPKRRKTVINLSILWKAIFKVNFVQILRFETENTLQIAGNACKMYHVFNNSLS
jgi:hypothetical protein